MFATAINNLHHGNSWQIFFLSTKIIFSKNTWNFSTSVISCHNPAPRLSQSRSPDVHGTSALTPSPQPSWKVWAHNLLDYGQSATPAQQSEHSHTHIVSSDADEHRLWLLHTIAIHGTQTASVMLSFIHPIHYKEPLSQVHVYLTVNWTWAY